MSGGHSTMPCGLLITATSFDMASVDAWSPSRRMQAAAAAEQARVERELERLNRRKEHLERELDILQATYDGLEGERTTLRRLSAGSDASELPQTDGPSPHLRVVSREREEYAGDRDAGPIILRGAKIRETAARILAATSQPDQAVHYRTWYDLLRREGFLPVGKDPLATFLTQIARSPVIRRSTAPGIYSLDFHAVQRESARLAELETQLKETEMLNADATVDEIARARERRSMLTAEVAAARRRHAEILRSLTVSAD